MQGVYGFSVQDEPGKTVEELARAGRIPNPTISCQDEAALGGSLLPLGYRLALIRTPGVGCHHEFAVVYDASGIMLQQLPDDAARALGRAFLHRPNPFAVP